MNQTTEVSRNLCRQTGWGACAMNKSTVTSLQLNSLQSNLFDVAWSTCKSFNMRTFIILLEAWSWKKYSIIWTHSTFKKDFCFRTNNSTFNWNLCFLSWAMSASLTHYRSNSVILLSVRNKEDFPREGIDERYRSRTNYTRQWNVSTALMSILRWIKMPSNHNMQ